jgi:transaldolase
MRTTHMQCLLDMKQSVWLDDLSRNMTRSGELRDLIERGLRGMTSNPTIFEQAIGRSTAYDDDLNKWSMSPDTDRDVYERLAIQDVREAADLFRAVYDSTGGRDGFVSLEASPGVARDTEGSVKEARRLWRAVDRPNAMIKIPGTRQGWPAIERCLGEGININITLLFSVNHYRAVAEAWLRALEARVERGESIESLASVASFFLSRIDTDVDARIQMKGGRLLALQGKAAIAQAQLAYAAYDEIIQSDRWRRLEAQGAKTQRLLWASTGTKNPGYSDVLYVESLVAPDTIATIPPQTLRLFEDHGVIMRRLGCGIANDATQVMDALAEGGIDLTDVNRTLEDEGIDKFTKSFENLLRLIGDTRKTFARAVLESLPGSLV